ncbi:hypothetical protein HK096_010933 [Nowakowskiella sp. JEL0078]|nr:hypothetical protein HK096_010933 [Nowakowskiella sp. JEL0078]
MSQSLSLTLRFPHYPPHVNNVSDSLANTFDPGYSEIASNLSFNDASPQFPIRRDSYPSIFHFQMPSDSSDQICNDTRISPPIDYEFYRSTTESSISSSCRASEASVDTEANSISLPASYTSPATAMPPLPFFLRNDFFQFPFSVPEYSSEIFAPKSDIFRKESVSSDQTTLFSSSVPNVNIECRLTSGKHRVLKSKKHRKSESIELTMNSCENEEDMKSTKLSPFACDQCGKVYKHASCLSKHKWEHTELWRETTHLSLSKHQQVQILEAASILVTLGNENGKDGLSINESIKDYETLSDPTDSAKEIEGVSDAAAAALTMVSMSEKYGSVLESNSKTIELLVKSHFDYKCDIEIDAVNLSPNPEDNENFEIDNDYEMQDMMMEMEIGDI